MHPTQNQKLHICKTCQPTNFTYKNCNNSPPALPKSTTSDCAQWWQEGAMTLTYYTHQSTLSHLVCRRPNKIHQPLTIHVATLLRMMTMPASSGLDGIGGLCPWLFCGSYVMLCYYCISYYALDCLHSSEQSPNIMSDDSSSSSSICCRRQPSGIGPRGVRSPGFGVESVEISTRLSVEL